jgi:hypothetical protein
VTPHEAEQVDRLVLRLVKELAGREPQMQGLILADLLATWLAGHIVKGRPAATEALRMDLLRHHVETVRRLIPIASQRIHGAHQRLT